MRRLSSRREMAGGGMCEIGVGCSRCRDYRVVFDALTT